MWSIGSRPHRGPLGPRMRVHASNETDISCGLVKVWFNQGPSQAHTLVLEGMINTR